MKYNFCKYLVFLILTVYSSVNLFSQEKEQIYIRNADLAKAETKTTPPQTSYIGNVQAYHKGAFIFCDNAIMKENVLYANGKVSILQNDTIQTYADTLIYDGDQNLAYLIGNVILINGKDTLYTTELEYNTETKIARYTKKALMKTEQTTLKSQIGVYDTKIKEAWFYEKVSIESDSLYITTDSLRYLTDQDESSWASPGIVKTNNATLYSENGNFNNKTKIGKFYDNAQYKEDTITASADTIFVDRTNDIFSLTGNSIYYTPSDSATAGRIFYNKKLDSLALETNAVYIGKSNRTTGDSITYNKKTEAITIKGESKIVDGSTTLSGKYVKYDKKSKAGYATGNVIYADTTENIQLWADTLDFNGDTKYVKATAVEGKKPVYASNQDGDSIYISGKTLLSYRTIIDRREIKVLDSLSSISKKSVVYFHMNLDSLDVHKLDKKTFKSYILSKYYQQELINYDTIEMTVVDSLLALDLFNFEKDTKKQKEIDTIQYLVVNKEVVVYKKDMQMLSDSLFFNGTDSIFTLFYDPIIWTDSTQMTADTISIQLQNKKVSGLKLQKNAFIISTEDFKFYNQIKGRNTFGNFKDGELEKIKVEGNAQLLYYLKDDKDKSYIGANTTEASNFLFLFESGKINEIRHFGNPQSKILPMKGTDHTGLRLEGFKLEFDNRPIGIQEVFFPRKRVAAIPQIKENQSEKSFEVDNDNVKFIKKN